MPVVIPYSIKVIATLLSVSHQFCLLQFIFRTQEDGPPSGRLPRRAPDCSHDVFLRFVMNALGRIEPKTVKMKFLDPVASIGDKELADWPAVFPIEINRIAPFVFALAIDVIVGVNAEIISVGSEVIVNDIENHP